MCLLAAVLALGFVRLGVEKTMPDYPDSLGDSLAPEKITGEYLLRTAAAQNDTLPVFGSSELKTTQICTHPANFFAGKRCGFQVDLIGRGSCQSLVYAMAIAASGESLTGKKAVLITAPQSYVEDGIAPDLFMANFSEQQMLTLLSDKTIPAEQRQYLARRVAELIEAYNAQYGASLQQTTAAGLLTRAAAKGQTALEVLLTPYAAISEWLLDTRDMTSSRRVIPKRPPCKMRRAARSIGMWKSSPPSIRRRSRPPEMNSVWKTAITTPTSAAGSRSRPGRTRPSAMTVPRNMTICAAYLQFAKQSRCRSCSSTSQCTARGAITQAFPPNGGRPTMKTCGVLPQNMKT